MGKEIIITTKIMGVKLV